MHQSTDQKNTAARAATEILNEVNTMSDLTRNDKELLKQIRNADRREEHDDFYREQVIEEQLDDDCIDDEESAFMIGYLAS